tara:strand:- start:4917 stop:5915 length:999 start_codon:yes stop_codon:yes gene_type:complete
MRLGFVSSVSNKVLSVKLYENNNNIILKIPVRGVVMSSQKNDLILTSVVLLISIFIISVVSIAVGKNSVKISGIPAVYFCAFLALGIQWLAWIPASIMKTERFYDLTGGLTYLIILGFSLWIGSSGSNLGTREILVTALVSIWSLRLSSFLYLRIHKRGKDGRFDELKTSFVRFLIPWTLQGLWIFLTMIVVIVINSQSQPSPPLGITDLIGLLLWIAGFLIEVVADKQKSEFNSKSENLGKWIDTGLWSKSRHPNYFGEILLWFGIACFGIACFEGSELVTWISPLFVYLLLTKVSGIPILDKRGLEKWGEIPEYIIYRESTPRLFPKLIK